MSFVNEFISPEDVEAYNLKEIDKKFIVGGTNARDWTIDRRRGMYLRNVAQGGGSEPELSNRAMWTFYWNGDELTLRLDLLEGKGGKAEPGWSHWRLISINGSFGLPEHLKPQRDEILETLHEALTAYQGGGVYSGDYTSYSVTLDIAEECVL